MKKLTIHSTPADEQAFHTERTANNLDMTNEKLDSLNQKLGNVSVVTIKGDKGDSGNDGKNADEEKIVYEIIKRIPISKDGKDGRSPLTVSKVPPRNPQKGDLWYQD